MTEGRRPRLPSFFVSLSPSLGQGIPDSASYAYGRDCSSRDQLHFTVVILDHNTHNGFRLFSLSVFVTKNLNALQSSLLYSHRNLFYAILSPWFSI